MLPRITKSRISVTGIKLSSCNWQGSGCSWTAHRGARRNDIGQSYWSKSRAYSPTFVNWYQSNETAFRWTARFPRGYSLALELQTAVISKLAVTLVGSPPLSITPKITILWGFEAVRAWAATDNHTDRHRDGRTEGHGHSLRRWSASPGSVRVLVETRW